MQSGPLKLLFFLIHPLNLLFRFFNLLLNCFDLESNLVKLFLGVWIGNLDLDFSLKDDEEVVTDVTVFKNKVVFGNLFVLHASDHLKQLVALKSNRLKEIQIQTQRYQQLKLLSSSVLLRSIKHFNDCIDQFVCAAISMHMSSHLSYLGHRVVHLKF